MDAAVVAVAVETHTLHHNVQTASSTVQKQGIAYPVLSVVLVILMLLLLAMTCVSKRTTGNVTIRVQGNSRQSYALLHCIQGQKEVFLIFLDA